MFNLTPKDPESTLAPPKPRHIVGEGRFENHDNYAHDNEGGVSLLVETKSFYVSGLL